MSLDKSWNQFGCQSKSERRKPSSGCGLLLACKVLVEDALGRLEGIISRDRYVRCDASSFPRWPSSSVRVNSGDAEEDVGLTNTESLGWVGGPGGCLSDDHSTAELLHDVNKLLGSTGSRSTSQDD